MMILEQKPVRDRALKIKLTDYHRMAEHGLLSEKSELLQGVIVEKMSKSPLHVKIVQRLYRFFLENLHEDEEVRQEQPITITAIDSEPEPDILVIEENADAFSQKHPETGKIVIEVAVSTLDLDRIKANDYAVAGIADYFLINTENSEVEHYSNPVNGHYEKITILNADTTLVFQINNRKISLPLSKLGLN